MKDSISKPRTSLRLKRGVCSAATLPFTNALAAGEEGEIPVNLVNLAASFSFVHCYFDSDVLIPREPRGPGSFHELGVRIDTQFWIRLLGFRLNVKQIF